MSPDPTPLREWSCPACPHWRHEGQPGCAFCDCEAGATPDFGPLSITRVKATTPDGLPFEGDEQWMAAGAVVVAAVARAEANEVWLESSLLFDAFLEADKALNDAVDRYRAYTRAATTPEPA